MHNNEKIQRIQLARSENIGPITFLHLINRFGSAHDALLAVPELAKNGGIRKSVRLASKQRATDEMRAAKAIGAHTIFYGENSYPKPLAQIPDPPPFFHCIGNPSILHKPAVAVVGTRRASANGRRLAAILSAALARAQYTVVSGMASGIDAAAHQHTLPMPTVAVLAGGVDVPYPKENRQLHQLIAKHGLIVSEAPPGAPPVANLFPKRNRIIAALTLGVVVIEATLRSGSMITAKLAADFGREIFAAPGSPMDPRSEGPNSLIRDGAALVSSPQDVIHVLQSLDPIQRDALHIPLPTAPLPNQHHDPSQEQRNIVRNLLSPEPVLIDELVRTSQVPAPTLLAALLELELAGFAKREPSGSVSLVIQT